MIFKITKQIMKDVWKKKKRQREKLVLVQFNFDRKAISAHKAEWMESKEG